MELNLRHVLKDRRISSKAVAAFLNVSEKTLQNKLTCKTDFTVPEAQKIKTELLSDYDFDYLFAPSTHDRNSQN